MKLNKYFVFKIASAIYLGFYSIFLIDIRANLIDSALAKNNFFQYLYLFIFIICIKRVIIIIDESLSDYYYDKLKSSNELKIINKFKKLPIHMVEEQSFKNLYETCFSESDYLREFINSTSKLVTSLITIIGTIYIFFKASRILAFSLSAFVLIQILIEYYSNKKNGDIWKNYKSNMRLANYLSNVLINGKYLSERKIFQTYNFFNKKFVGEYKNASKTNSRLGKQRLYKDIIYDISFIALVVFSIFQFSFNELKFANIGKISSMLYQTIDIRFFISDLVAAFFNCQKGFFIKKQYDKLLDEKEEKMGNITIDKIYSIEFCDVFFSYPNSKKKVLDGVSFKLDNNSFALVGENGSGKTTLTKLILGIYKPDSGKILINGINIDDLNRRELTKNISIVMQQSYHYPAKLCENLSFKNPLFKYDENIFKMTELNEIIDKLPNGLDTDLSGISKNSVSLSGGEWQKIAIARSLLESSSVYILDEPNALLDPISEAKMYRYYNQLLKDKISLLITHRLGAVKFINKIIVLKDGKIYKIGSHEELMKTEYYSNLYNIQKEMYI